MRELSDGGSCYVSIYGVELKGYVSEQSYSNEQNTLRPLVGYKTSSVL